MQCLLHPWIRQTETLLQQVNAQNGLEGKGLTTAFGARACRREDMSGVAEKIQSWIQETVWPYTWFCFFTAVGC